MPDLRTTIKSLLEYDEKKPVHVRDSAALTALTDYLSAHAPEVADGAATYLLRQRANGELIPEHKNSGRVYVVGYWSASGAGHLWFRDKTKGDAAWAEEVAAAKKVGDGYYAFKFVTEGRELDIPHRITDDISRKMTEILDYDDTISYDGKGVYRKGQAEITEAQAEKW